MSSEAWLTGASGTRRPKQVYPHCFFLSLFHFLVSVCGVHVCVFVCMFACVGHTCVGAWEGLRLMERINLGYSFPE